MMPLPAPHATEGKIPGEPIPALPVALTAPTGPYSSANRRASSGPHSRAYPWLLSISTAIAALFCLMYITKPVIISSAAPVPSSARPPVASQKTAPPAAPLSAQTAQTAQASMLPKGDHLPGDRLPPAANVKSNGPLRAMQGPSATSVFEETNLRIQHVLTAEAPGGHLARIDLDVPVLYQSRSLRWTPDDVAAARLLLARLMDYQEKSRQLRAEGGDLLAAWNRLIGSTLPATDLRADSPSLPANQEDAADIPRPAGLNTTESIQIQPTGK
jgi:hypothetical protein